MNIKKVLELKEALKDGTVKMETINEAVRRSLTMKYHLGLLEKNPKIGVDGALDFDPLEIRGGLFSPVEKVLFLGVRPLGVCLFPSWFWQALISFFGVLAYSG